MRLLRLSEAVDWRAGAGVGGRAIKTSHRDLPGELKIRVWTRHALRANQIVVRRRGDRRRHWP